MIFCETCQDTGACPCGATDCKARCEDCYCDSCSQAGTKIVGKMDDGKPICEDCSDHIAGHYEPRNVSAQDDPNDD